MTREKASHGPGLSPIKEHTTTDLHNIIEQL